MTRAHPTRWFAAAFAVGVLAASLVTCSRCGKAGAHRLGFVDRATVQSCDAVYARWRAMR